MTLRSFAALLTVWAWILVPALCTAGVLAHGCPCEDEVPCAHESDCHADPCSEPAVRQPDANWTVAAQSAAAATVRPGHVPGDDAFAGPLTPTPSPPRLRLPRPPSDLPLLN